VLVVNCALAGEIEEARMALQSLKRLIPDISLKWISGLPFVHDDYRQRFVEGFRLAGLE
jgi:hypothetical protein